MIAGTARGGVRARGRRPSVGTRSSPPGPNDRREAPAPPVEPIAEGDVRGAWHHAPGPPGAVAVLTHGAGSHCATPLLVALAERFADRGVAVLRCDLPFRQASPTGPPRPGAAARDREGLRSAVTMARGRAPGPIVLGGHSYGGRQATILAAQAPGLVDALLCLGYPLHPPGQPGRPRIAHFPALRIPALFVHGDRDRFATLDELRAALAHVVAPTRLLAVAGAGHDLGGARAPARVPLDAVVDALLELLSRSRSG